MLIYRKFVRRSRQPRQYNITFDDYVERNTITRNVVGVSTASIHAQSPLRNDATSQISETRANTCGRWRRCGGAIYYPFIPSLFQDLSFIVFRPGLVIVGCVQMCAAARRSAGRKDAAPAREAPIGCRDQLVRVLTPLRGERASRARTAAATASLKGTCRERGIFHMIPLARSIHHAELGTRHHRPERRGAGELYATFLSYYFPLISRFDDVTPLSDSRRRYACPRTYATLLSLIQSPPLRGSYSYSLVYGTLRLSSRRERRRAGRIYANEA